jgi:hypothetical protein
MAQLRRRENKTERQETKETLKMLVKNYHTIHSECEYRAIRKMILNETGFWILYKIIYSLKEGVLMHPFFFKVIFFSIHQLIETYSTIFD